MESKSNPVYFVDVKFKKLDGLVACGVWEGLSYICKSWKNWGWRSNHYYNHCGEVEYIRVTKKDRDWSNEEHGPPKVLSVNTYNQREMRALAKNTDYDDGPGWEGPAPTSCIIPMNMHV